MNSIKFLGALGACALLVACGSKDDGGPAELDRSDLGTVSPFDTLMVEFDQKIRLPNADDVTTTNDLKVVKVDARNLVVTGDSAMAGYGFFVAGTDYTVTFSNVENDVGDKQKAPQTVRFTTLPFIDSDFTECEVVKTFLACRFNDGFDTPDALMNATGAAFFDGAALAEGTQVAGMLAFNKMRNATQYGKDDLVDTYVLKLRMDDTVDVKLSGLDQNLDLEFMGPRSLTDSLDFAVASAQKSANTGVLDESITYIIGREHRTGATNFEDLADYAIRVKFADSNPAGASPYVLSVAVRPYRE